MLDFVCEVCHVKFRTYAGQRRGKYITCSNKCFGIISSRILKGRKNNWINIEEATKRLPHGFGKESSRWKGGKYFHSKGYVFVLSPQHPSKNKQGYVLEHRLVMEKHLGRFLTPNEKVHHIDGNKSNNLIHNLVLVSNHSIHMSIYHKKLRNKLGQFT